MTVLLRENDVYCMPNGVLYRFIRRNRDEAHVIELGKSAATLTCVDWSALESRLSSGEYTTRPYQGVSIAHYKPSAKDEEHRQRRLALTKPLLTNPALFQRKLRNKLIEARALEMSVSPQTIRTLLAMWFQGGQTEDALLTNYKNSGRPNPLSDGPRSDAKPSKKKKIVDPNFVGPPSPFEPSPGASYKTSHRSRPFSLRGGKRLAVRQLLRELHDNKVPRTKTYRAVIEALFCDADGNWLPEWLIPSEKQIRDLRNEVVGVKEKLVETHGKASVENNQKPLTGSVLEHAIGAGYVYEVDSTKVDVWIVDRAKRHKIIGKATCYFVVCRFSRAIVGFHLTLDSPSWAGAMDALCTVVMDKRKLCEFWGAKYVESTWVKGDTMCAFVVADRGTEWMGFDSDQIAEGVKIGFSVMPAQMSVLKGIVECTFKLAGRTLGENLPGYEQPQNILARQKEKDYERLACLTLDEVAVELIDFIGLHNNHIYENMQLDPELAGIVPTPMNVWNADIYRRTGMHRGMDEEYLRANLRPTKRVVVRREGIKVNGCYYHCDEAYRDEWFESAAKARFKIRVSYDRPCVDYIWVHNPQWGDEPVKATLAPRSQHYKGLSVREVWVNQMEAKLAIEGARYENNKSRAQYERRSNARVKVAIQATAESIAAHPGESRMSGRPLHRGAEQSARSQERAHGKPVPLEASPSSIAPTPSHDNRAANAPVPPARTPMPQQPARKQPAQRPSPTRAATDFMSELLAPSSSTEVHLSPERMERIVRGQTDA